MMLRFHARWDPTMLTTPSRRVASILDDGGPENASRSGLERQILREVVAMGLPSMASFLLLTVYDLVDIFWLAKLGEAPVAAVTVFSAFLWVLSFPNNVVGSGSVAIISQRFGAGDRRRTELSIKNTFLAKIVFGLTLGGLGLVYLPTALEFLGAEPSVVRSGTDYGRIQCSVLALSLASFSVYTALRSIGRPALGMWLSAGGALVNLVLDPLLIFGIGPFPALGIQGAAVASALGFTTVTIAGAIALASRHSPVPVRWFSEPYPDWTEMLQILRIGLPAGIAALSFSLSASIVVKLVAIYGTSVVALFGMAQKVLRFGVMIIAGLGLGTGALVGQYLGSRRLRHAWLASVISMFLGAGTLFVYGLLLFAFAPLIVRGFFSDPALLDAGVLYLRILSIGLPFTGILLASENAFAGAGQNTPTMIANVLTSWALTIPLMYVLGEVAGLGPVGMMAGSACGSAIAGFVGLWLVRRGTWLENPI
jgi:putative MATE family efflux protein